MFLSTLITPPHLLHFCWPLWKQQPLTLGDVWVRVEGVRWSGQPLLYEHCALFLTRSLVGLSSGPHLGHRSGYTAVITAAGFSVKSGSVAPICWQHGTKTHYVLFGTSFLHFGSLLMISAESKDSLKQMSTSVAPPFCHCGRTWACIQLRKSSKLPSRKAFSNYQINPSYRKYRMFKMPSNQW